MIRFTQRTYGASRQGRVDTKFLRQLTKKVPRSKIIVALNTAHGHIAVHGWQKTLALQPEQVMSQIAPFCADFLCTGIDREGAMTSANLPWFKKLRQSTTLPIIAAAGIKTRREISALQKIGMDAAVSMAIYKNRLH